ncbi:MAG TPA: adenylate kinase [Actinomycetota bacterium]|nr:adenylate kinase [Actinomycetota bacterium]
MRIMVLGPPGAGKGTQASRLADKLGIPHIATGDMFREAAAMDTEFGRRVRKIMESGELLPDDLTNELVRERLSRPDARNGFILDGYPRNVDQALELDEILDKLGTKIDLVIKFMVRGPDIVERLRGRRVCPVCRTVYHMQTQPPKDDEVCDNDGVPLIRREDDQEETTLRRLEVYGQQTRPLYELYAERGLLVDMDALGTTDEVFTRLLAVVGR